MGSIAASDGVHTRRRHYVRMVLNMPFTPLCNFQVKITESFVWSVDYVAEKIRISRQAGEDIDKFIVVYFDYAGEHDVPPKLDVAIRYTLMNDMLSLYCHLHGVKWETMAGTAPDSLLDSGDQMELVDRENNNKVEAGQVVSSNGVTHDTFTQTHTGGELLKAINAAKKFFKENPDWLGEILEAIGNAATPSPNPKNKVNGKEEQSEVKPDDGSTTDGTKSPESQTDSQESSPSKKTGENENTEDSTYKERQKRRMKEEERQLDLLQMDDEKQTNGEVSKENVSDKSSPVSNGRVPPLPPQKSISLVDLPVNHSPSFNQRRDNSDDIPVDNTSYPGKLSRTVSNPNDGDFLRKELQLNSPDFNKTRNPNEKRRNSKSQSNTTLQRMHGQYTSNDSILSNGLDDDELQKDIEFIQNFDAHHAHVHNQSPPSLAPLQTLNTVSTIAPPILGQPSRPTNDLDPIVLDLDLSEYTPPEDFITLANQFENNHGNAESHDSNALVNGLDDNATITMETNGDVDQDSRGFVNPIFDSNANKLGVKSMNHFVIDFVDPSVKNKPEQLKRASSTSSS